MSAPAVPLRELAGRAAVYDAAGGDPFVRAEFPYDRPARAWAGPDGAVVFERRGRLTAVGPPPVAAAVLAAVAAGLADPPRAVTVPRGALPLLPAALRPPHAEDWDWFWTDRPPPAQPGEALVDWLDGVPDAELLAFLRSASPRYSAEPGSPSVRRWCGVRDAGGALAATAAYEEHVPGVPHLASIATRADRRGRGLGGAVSAWLTRALLPVTGWVTLGMYADNDVARRVYDRLGFTRGHCFASGRLP